jgi:hypothetical protein
MPIEMPTGIVTIHRRVLDDKEVDQFDEERLVKDMRPLSHFEVQNH